MLATITSERWEATGIALDSCVPGLRIRYVMLKRLLGLLSSAHQVVPLGLLHMRRLQLWFARYHRKLGDDARHNQYMITVPASVVPDLDHWKRACADRVGVPMGPRAIESTIYTDASLSGLGGYYGPEYGAWGAA